MIARLKFRTEQARKRERIRVILRFSALSFGVLAFFGLLTYGCHLKHLRIQNIYVQTDGSLSDTALASTIQAELKGKILGILPKDSVFISQNKDLENILRDAYPRIAESEVKRAGFSTLNAKIEERTPFALWCGDVVPSVASEQTTEDTQTTEELWGTCYLMDETGFIYANSPIFSGNMFPRYYGSLKEAEPIAQQYMPALQFKEWQSFYTSLEHNDIAPQALLFVDERDIELYLSNGMRVLISRDEKPDVTLERLLTLLKSNTVDKERALEYIDLRFGTKVYVKYIENSL
jgi:cell division septal protein FtsQ